MASAGWRPCDELVEDCSHGAWRNCFMEARGKNAVFGIRGRSGSRMFTLQASGALYRFVHDLSALRAEGLLAADFDPTSIVSGRTVPRRLEELRAENLQRFLAAIAPFCAGQS